MREALHILRKDLRSLWPPILVSLVLTAALAWRQSDEYQGDYLQPLQLLSWAYLAVAVISKERPAGDRQYWLTRPYSRASLLGAKLLFLILCVNLPLLLADVGLVLEHSLRPEPWPLLARQVAVMSLLLLPTAAVTAVTSSLAQVVVALLVIVSAHQVIPALWSGGTAHWEWLNWMHAPLLVLIGAVAGLAVLWWQYTRRGSAAGRVILMAGVLASVGSLVTPLPDAVLDMSLWAEPAELSAVQMRADLLTPYQFHLTPEGLPAGLRMVPESLAVEMRGDGNHVWRSGWLGPPDIRWRGDISWSWRERDGTFLLDVAFSSVLVERFNAARMRPSLSLVMMVVRREPLPPLKLGDAPREAPDIGSCAIRPAVAQDTPVLLCVSALFPRGWLLAGPFISFGGHSPFMAMKQWSPVWGIRIPLDRVLPAGAPFTTPVPLAVHRPLGRIRRDITVIPAQP